MYRIFRSKVAVLQEGKEPLPLCNMCGMHMLARRMIKHQRTARCFNNTDMQLRHRSVEVTSQCLEIELSLTEEEGEVTI